MTKNCERIRISFLYIELRLKYVCVIFEKNHHAKLGSLKNYHYIFSFNTHFQEPSSLSYRRTHKTLFPCNLTKFLKNISEERVINTERLGPRKIDNWGGGGHIFIYSCCSSLISFEIDCFYSL